MSQIKKLIIFFMIIIIVILGILIFVIYQNKAQIIYGIDEIGDTVTYDIDRKIKKVSVRNDYYIVKKCINKFYLYCSSMHKNATVIYEMLDKEYINLKGITIDNIETKLKKIEGKTIKITNMYVSELTENVSIYFIDAKIKEKSLGELIDIKIIVKLDSSNRTFSIFLDDYINENIEIGKEMDFNISNNNIEKNNYNGYNYEIISNDIYIEDVLSIFKENLFYDEQKAYESLDEEYRKKRFPTFEDFEKYIKDNIREISAMKISQYDKNVSEDKVQYICKDTNNNYYIINEESTMNCTFILDTYTIDLPEFLDKYKKSNDREKVALNIEKIKEAINAKDFKYVYNKIDETFRNNNFKSYSNFENYIKSNLFDENTFEYKNIEQTANIYVATVIVKNEKNINEEKEIKIIMKLTDTTDYVISFSTEK